MNFKIRTLPLAVALLFSAGAHAENLAEIYKEAKSYDATYASAQAALEAGREKLPQGRSGLLPTLTASGYTQWDNTNNQVFGSQYSFNQNGWQVQLTQPLFRWQNFVQYNQSDFQVMQAEAQAAQAGQDLIIRVAQAYFDVLGAEDNLALVRAQKVAISEQLAQAKRNFEVGTATITDTNEAQARYDLATSQEIAAESDLEIKRRALQQIVGHEPEKLAPLKSGVTLQQPQPAQMDDWVKAAEQANYTVKSSEAAYEVAKREVDRQRAGHYPTLDAFATARADMASNVPFVGQTGPRGYVEQRIVGLQLNIPLYAGGATLSRTRESAALAEQARQNFESAKRNAALGARTSYLSVTNGLAQVKALEQALKSSETALESNKVGYKVGVRINIDVLNAEQQVTSTKRDLAKARYDTIVNSLKLKAATSSLTEQELAHVNDLLEPSLNDAGSPSGGNQPLQ